jgi:hypothetical protein
MGNYNCFKDIRNYKEEVLSAVLWVVTPCSLVESLQVSKQSYIINFGFIISLYGDIGGYSLHKVCCSFCYYYSQWFFLLLVTVFDRKLLSEDNELSRPFYGCAGATGVSSLHATTHHDTIFGILR